MLSAEFTFEAIGTGWQIHTVEPLGGAVKQAIAARVEEFDLAWSRFRPDSLITRIAASAGSYRLPADAGPLLALYRTLYLTTDGAVTPLVGASLEHLGYDAQYSLRPGAGHRKPDRWEDVMDWDDATGILTTTAPVLLDVGAAGKGCLVDLLSELLGDHGHPHHLVDGSGDLRHRGPESHRIALEHPANPQQAIGIVNLSDAALCASAVNRRAWAPGVHHVLDGRTGVPADDVIATWVVAPTAMVADGLATALFLAPPAALAADHTFTYVRMFADGRAEYSPSLDGELFT